MITINQEDQEHPGQIQLTHKFGAALREEARRAETIVELGTFWGTGSTYCMYRGMERDTQRLYSVDNNPVLQDYAKTLYAHDPRVIFIFGEVLAPDKSVLAALPPQIDLLLIDAGDWEASAELQELIARCKVIALDDCSPDKGIKNASNRIRLAAFGWKIISEDMGERNGFAIFSHPTFERLPNIPG